MIVIDIDGNVSEREYKGDIQELYNAIGCRCFDAVRLRNGLVMFVDDEGMLKENAFNLINWKATYLRLNEWMSHAKDIGWVWARTALPPTIVGNVCILAAHEDGSESNPDESQRNFILKLLGEEV
jgi:hypothetical protein